MTKNSALLFLLITMACTYIGSPTDLDFQYHRGERYNTLEHLSWKLYLDIVGKLVFSVWKSMSPKEPGIYQKCVDVS